MVSSVFQSLAPIQAARRHLRDRYPGTYYGGAAFLGGLSLFVSGCATRNPVLVGTGASIMTSGLELSASGDPFCETARTKNRFLLDTYPSKYYGALALPGSSSLIISGILTDNIGMVGAGVSGVAGNVGLIIWGDPKTPAAQIPHATDPQDQKKFLKFLMPWRYPWEFMTTADFAATAGFGAASHQTKAVADYAATGFALLGSSTFLVPERAPEPPSQQPGGGMFNKLAGGTRRAKQWVQERPTRAAAYVFVGCNVALIVGGLLAKDFAKAATGAWFLAINPILTHVSKRVQAKAAASTPT